MTRFATGLLFPFVLGLCWQLTACDSGPKAPTFKVDTWVSENKTAVETLRGQLASAVALIESKPAISVRLAEPATPIRPITPQWGEGENMVILRGVSLPGLPEYGQDEGKSIEKAETSIGVGYTGFVDLASAFAMVDTGKELYIRRHAEGVGLGKRIRMIRYAIIGRELAYSPGTIDELNRSFVPGSYAGVAQIVDLQGPVHIGSVRFEAVNTGSFESYQGSEAFMLQADLAKQAQRAFHAELGRLFPDIVMPPPPAKAAN